MSDLLPCPFCGEEVDMYPGDYVLCPDCGANMGFYDTEKAAIEAWNKRAPDPRVVDLKKRIAVWKCAAKNHRWAFRGLCRISRGKFQVQHERITALEAQLSDTRGSYE